MENKITKEDVDFIKTSFIYAMERMESLDISHWGDYKTKYRRIQEVKTQQWEILDKLYAFLNK
jgi:hypothetical protein